jgi:RNA polymerase sigma-70 factor, ECF subfamily
MVMCEKTKIPYLHPVLLSPIRPSNRSQAMPEPGTVTLFLRRLNDGDMSALDELMPLLFDELHRVASHRLRSERPGHTLGATALVNEVYLKMVDHKLLEMADRSEFLAVASRIMRNILVDYARTRRRAKRGGGLAPVPLDDVAAFLSDQEAEEVLALDEALARLMQSDERAGLVIQYRFFGGLTLDETAELMGISKRSIQRSWTMARAWLRKEMAGGISLE